MWPCLGEGATVDSECDSSYNCVGWAMHDKNLWDPLPSRIHIWPNGVSRDGRLGSYVAMFQHEGFEHCAKDAPRDGYEHIAIYVDRNAEFMHVARELPNGRWTSKLGGLNDITHDLDDLVGTYYGNPTVYMRRPRAT